MVYGNVLGTISVVLMIACLAYSLGLGIYVLIKKIVLWRKVKKVIKVKALKKHENEKVD